MPKEPAAVTRAAYFRAISHASNAIRVDGAERRVDGLTRHMDDADGADGPVGEGPERAAGRLRALWGHAPDAAAGAEGLDAAAAYVDEVLAGMGAMADALPEYRQVLQAAQSLAGQAAHRLLASRRAVCSALEAAPSVAEDPAVRRAELALDAAKKSKAAAVEELESLDRLLLELRGQFAARSTVVMGAAQRAADAFAGKLADRTALHERIEVLYRQQGALLAERRRVEHVGDALQDLLRGNYALVQEREALVSELVRIEGASIAAADQRAAVMDTLDSTGCRVRPRILHTRGQLEAAEATREGKQRTLEAVTSDCEALEAAIADADAELAAWRAQEPLLPAAELQTIAQTYKAVVASQAGLLELRVLRGVVLPIVAAAYPEPHGFSAFVTSTHVGPDRTIPPAVVGPVSQWWVPRCTVPDEQWSLSHTERRALQVLRLAPPLAPDLSEAAVAAALILSEAAPNTFQHPPVGDNETFYCFLQACAGGIAISKAIAQLVGVGPPHGPDDTASSPHYRLVAANVFKYAHLYRHASSICAAFAALCEGVAPVGVLLHPAERLRGLFSDQEGGGPPAASAAAASAPQRPLSCRQAMAAAQKKYLAGRCLAVAHLCQLQFLIAFECDAPNATDQCTALPLLVDVVAVAQGPLAQRVPALMRAAVAHHMDHAYTIADGIARQFSQAPPLLRVADARRVLEACRWITEETPLTLYGAALTDAPASHDQGGARREGPFQPLSALHDGPCRLTKIAERPPVVRARATDARQWAPPVPVASYRHVGPLGAETLVSAVPADVITIAQQLQQAAGVFADMVDAPPAGLSSGPLISRRAVAAAAMIADVRAVRV